MKTICVFGDSVTWGAWDYDKGGWVERLKLSFFKDGEIDIYNLGISGDNTNYLLERFKVECEAREPNIIIFQVGDNDSFTNSTGEVNVSLEQFEKNILELIKLAKKFTNKIIFIGLTPINESKTMPVPWNKDVNYTVKNVKKYDEKLKSLVEKDGNIYIGIFDVISKEDLEDGIHLNIQGHEKLFNKVKNYLAEKELI